MPCWKTVGQGQAYLACNQNKQQCEGVQWVAVLGLPNLEELVTQVTGLWEDNAFFLKNFTLNIKHLTVVMGEIVDNQQYYMMWKMEELRLVGSLRMMADYSELRELALWHKFHKWQRDVAEQESLNVDSKEGSKDMVIDEDEVEAEEKEGEGKKDEGEEEEGKEGEDEAA